MQARVVPFTPVMVDAEGRAMGVGRGTGLHLSEILLYMRRALDPRLDKLVAAGPGNTNFCNAGFMFELWVEQALATYIGYSDRKYLITPGEMEVDGIAMNPDRFHVGEGKVVEFKATWKSSRKLFDANGELNVDVFEELFYYYRWQGMAYCHGLGCTKLDIVVWFVNGDYTFKDPTGGPRFYVFEFEFTDQEILDNWKMICGNAEAVRRMKGRTSGKAQA